MESTMLLHRRCIRVPDFADKVVSLAERWEYTFMSGRLFGWWY